MKFYTTIFLIILAKFAFCQTTPLTLKQIDSTVAVINSTPKYDSMIEDGTVENTRKGIFKKIFIKKKVGGYSTTYFSDRVKNKLIKVIFEESFTEFTREEYFYANDNLIFIKVTKRQQPGDFKLLSLGQFYFQQGLLVKKTGDDSLSNPGYLVKAGRRMLGKWHAFKNPLKK